MESREEKETSSSSSSPSKAAAQKVSHMLEGFTQIVVWSFVQHSVNQMKSFGHFQGSNDAKDATNGPDS